MWRRMIGLVAAAGVVCGAGSAVVIENNTVTPTPMVTIPSQETAALTQQLNANTLALQQLAAMQQQTAAQTAAIHRDLLRAQADRDARRIAASAQSSRWRSSFRVFDATVRRQSP